MLCTHFLLSPETGGAVGAGETWWEVGDVLAAADGHRLRGVLIQGLDRYALLRQPQAGRGQEGKKYRLPLNLY